jgi:hypothetical protein
MTLHKTSSLAALVALCVTSAAFATSITPGSGSAPGVGSYFAPQGSSDPLCNVSPTAGPPHKHVAAGPNGLLYVNGVCTFIDYVSVYGSSTPMSVPLATYQDCIRAFNTGYQEAEVSFNTLCPAVPTNTYWLNF